MVTDAHLLISRLSNYSNQESIYWHERHIHTSMKQNRKSRNKHAYTHGFPVKVFRKFNGKRIPFSINKVKTSQSDCPPFLRLPHRLVHGAFPWGSHILMKEEKKHTCEANSKCGLDGSIWEKDPESNCSRESGVVSQISNEVMKKMKVSYIQRLMDLSS